MLRIYLLGPFRAERNSQVIPRQEWARPKDRDVLKLLALHGGHLVPQDRLIEWLWPDLAPTAAAKSLHVAVSRLRKLVGSAVAPVVPPLQVVRRDAAGYTLASEVPVWIDLGEFRRLLGQGREWQRRGAWAPAVAAYRAAEALYRGDLFEDDPYAEWAIGPREQLRETHLAAQESLADCLLRLGAGAEAVEVCERGLGRDRTREGLYVQLMRAHAAAGHVAEAVQAYERCRLALAEELGVDPGPAVRAIHERLLTGEAPSAFSLAMGPTPRTSDAELAADGHIARPRGPHRSAGQLRLPCVGRERELARFASHVSAAQDGRGGLVLVHGEPGVGKSRLLEEIGQLAEARGVRVLTARCYEMERDLPYAALVEVLTTFLLERANPAEVAPALGRWGPQLAALLPALRDLVPDLPVHQALRQDAERASLLAGLTQLVLALGRRTPLALLLDDLQWSDPSTVQWLHYLARRLSREPVLVAGAYRSAEVNSDHPLQRLVSSLADDPAAPQLVELDCLTMDHVAALLPAISGSATRGSALAARLHRETDGHPLHLVETLRTLLETGVLKLDEQGGWAESSRSVLAPGPTGEREARLPLPPSLREAILWRVRRLNERERRVLTAAAVVERGFGPELLARMTDLTLDDILDTLEALTGRQLVRPSGAGRGFDFHHDLIQAVVYGGLGPERRRSLHARAAEALEALAEGRPQALREAAGELAHHLWRADRWASAFRYALLAGDHARDAFAPREALAHYRRAAELADRQPELLENQQRPRLLERLGRAHAELGELDEAVRQFTALREQARGSGDRLLEGRTLAALADAHYWRHDFVHAEALAAEALAVSKELGNQELVAATLLSATNVAMAQGQTDKAEAHCAAVLALAEAQVTAEGADPSAFAGARLNALGWMGIIHQWRGDHERARPAIEASLRLGHELHSPFLTGRSRFAWSMSLGNSGRYEEALTALGEALRLAEEAGDRYWLPRLPNTIGWIYSELGDLEQADDWNQQSIAAARETRWLEAESNARINLGTDALRRGERARAHDEFDQAVGLLERDNWFTWRYRMRLLVGLGELALLEGFPERALSFAREALTVAEPTTSRKHAGRAWLLSGRAMLAAGAAPESVLAHVERGRSLAIATGHPPLLWSSNVELARLYARLGREADAMTCRAEARAAVETVAASIEDSALRRSMLGSPPIQAILASGGA